MTKKQVDKSHYDFQRYMSKRRWNSVWHQINEVIQLNPSRVLEIGAGIGTFKAMAGVAGLHVETLDIDPDLKPDHIGSANEIPLPDFSYDVVCAFQMLEHLPYEQSKKAFAEMVRVSRKFIVISLPDAKIVWNYVGHIPKFGAHNWLIPRPFSKTQNHNFDGEHYWEINKRGYELSKVTKDFMVYAKLMKSYRVPENTYHHFFVFEKTQTQNNLSE